MTPMKQRRGWGSEWTRHHRAFRGSSLGLAICCKHNDRVRSGPVFLCCSLPQRRKALDAALGLGESLPLPLEETVKVVPLLPVFSSQRHCQHSSNERTRGILPSKWGESTSCATRTSSFSMLSLHVRHPARPDWETQRQIHGRYSRCYLAVLDLVPEIVGAHHCCSLAKIMKTLRARISLRTLHSSFTIDINSTKKGKRNPSTAIADTPHRQQLELVCFVNETNRTKH